MCRTRLPLVAAFLCLGVSAGFAQQSKPASAKPAAIKPGATKLVADRPPSAAFDKAKFEQYVRHMFVWGEQIDVTIGDPKPSTQLPGFREVVVSARAGQASQEDTFFLSNDGTRVFRGAVYDLTKGPFASDESKLKTEQDPSFGPAGAPVSLVVFSDFQCSFCKEEAKILRENVATTYGDKVRVTFKDFPLEPIHPWAKPAAIAGRCVLRQKPDLFWDFHDWIFEKQGEITAENLKEKVNEWAATKPLESIQFAACIENKTTEPEVARNQAEGKTLAINSTPTMFVNGRRMVGGVPWQQLKTIVDHEIEFKKSQAEKCCEVSLPTPVK